MAPTRGLLYVTMQPKDGLPLAQFNDWYNNEHGPNRLRLPFFETGFRYKAVDGLEPEYMAMYDVDDMAWLEKEVYTRLRSAPVQSQRERDTMKQIAINRRFYDGVGETRKYGEDGESWLVVSFVQAKSKDDLRGCESAVEEEVNAMKALDNWKRSQKFQTSTLDNFDQIEGLWIHEYSAEITLDKVKNAIISKSTRGTGIIQTTRIYQRFYTFGPAPRDISSPQQDTIYPDGLTKVLTSQAADFNAVESYITTPDGVQLHYHLEGNPDPDAPLIVLVNSILTTYGIWDSFIVSFLSSTQNRKYRILRFNSRGRTAQTGTATVTVNTLASDVVALLDALKVHQAAAVIGVSLGGATALNVALRHPSRINAFVACDTNAMAPPGNPKAWGERIEMAEKDGASDNGESVVGNSLAEVTVRRWFTADGYADEAIAREIERVKAMVAGNSLDGFKKGVKALYEYDFRDAMKEATTKGMFLVGAGDGVLPKTMKEMAEMYGDGTSPLAVVDKAGHLPMVERPEEFASEISQFLEA